MSNGSIESLILGVISNGMSALISLIGRKAGRVIVGKEILDKMKREATALQPILKKAVDAVTERIDWKGPSRLEEVCLFLSSPEVEAIVRQIYSAKLSVAKAQNSMDSIRKEFLTGFSLYTRLQPDEIGQPVELLVDALILGCEQALSLSIDEGILSAHEAKSASRHRIILDELSNIQKNLGFLTKKSELDIQAILEFEKKYLLQVASRHGHIIPPYFDAARKLPIEDIYVPTNFIMLRKKGREEAPALKIRDFLSAIYRAVLLGNPGGGKSTFAAKLCYDLAINYSERLFAGRQVAPILIILRDYGAEKKVHNYSILQYAAVMATSKYQIQPPAFAFEYMLLNGRAVVIFDGLDELLDTSYRQEISSDIESFCALYPSVPVLVTSRQVGYEQAPLDEKKFEIFRLAPFDEEQVSEYVHKWFAVDTDLSTEQRKSKAEAFLEAICLSSCSKA